MADISLKNGLPVFKNGSIASSCSCCGNNCAAYTTCKVRFVTGGYEGEGAEGEVYDFFIDVWNAQTSSWTELAHTNTAGNTPGIEFYSGDLAQYGFKPYPTDPCVVWLRTREGPAYAGDGDAWPVVVNGDPTFGRMIGGFTGIQLDTICGCICKAPGPRCCNAPDELYLTLSYPGGFTSAHYDINQTNTLDIDFTAPSISGTYTLTNAGFAKACGLYYENAGNGVGVPKIQVTITPDSSGRGLIAINVYQLNISSGNGHVRDFSPGYYDREYSGIPISMSFSNTGTFAHTEPPTPEPVSVVSGKYPCDRFSEIGSITLWGTVGAANDLGAGQSLFTYWCDGIERGAGAYGSWSTPLTMTAQFTSP